MFQSTLPHGERQLLTWSKYLNQSFNPRSHMGSDYLRISLGIHLLLFQSTLPHGERPVFVEQPPNHDKRFQSTLPHGERRHSALLALPIRVSIHAPTWGATLREDNPAKDIPSFNPRSHMGSDIKKDNQTCKYHKFQSTLPHGERPANS